MCCFHNCTIIVPVSCEELTRVGITQCYHILPSVSSHSRKAVWERLASFMWCICSGKQDIICFINAVSPTYTTRFNSENCPSRIDSARQLNAPPISEWWGVFMMIWLTASPNSSPYEQLFKLMVGVKWSLILHPALFFRSYLNLTTFMEQKPPFSRWHEIKAKTKDSSVTGAFVQSHLHSPKRLKRAF